MVSVNTRSGANKFPRHCLRIRPQQVLRRVRLLHQPPRPTKAEDNQNQFGGNLGGPIEKQPGLFFFFNYEGTRIKQGVLSDISTVPLPNERIGDFSSATAAAAGVTYPTIYDPTTCQTAFSGSNCQPFANNSIPSGSLDSTMQALMALFPAPNTTTAGSPPNLNNYIRNALLTDFKNNYDGRADWTPSASNTVFVRFNYFNRTRDIPGYLGGIADGTSTSAWGNQILKAPAPCLAGPTSSARAW